MRSVKLLRIMAIVMIFLVISASSFAAVKCYTIEGAVQKMVQEGSEHFDTIESLSQRRGISREHVAYIVLLASQRGDIVEDLQKLQNENLDSADIGNYLQQIDNAATEFDLAKAKELLAESVQISRALSAGTPQQARDLARARVGKEVEEPVEEAPPAIPEVKQPDGTFVYTIEGTEVKIRFLKEQPSREARIAKLMEAYQFVRENIRQPRLHSQIRDQFGVSIVLDIPKPDITEFREEDMEVISELGVGGTASVDKVRIKGREYALKIAKVGMEKDLIWELNVLKELERRNIDGVPKVYGIVDFGDGHYGLVEELVEGKEYDAKDYTESQRRDIYRQLKNTITQLNSNGFYHNDFAPRNAVVAADGRAIVIDFGTLAFESTIISDQEALEKHFNPDTGIFRSLWYGLRERRHIANSMELAGELADAAVSKGLPTEEAPAPVVAPAEVTPARRLGERIVNRLTPILDPASVIVASAVAAPIAFSVLGAVLGGEFFPDASHPVLGAIAGTILAAKTSLKPVSWIYHRYKSPPQAGNIDAFFTKIRKKTDAVADPEAKEVYTPVVIKEGVEPAAEEDKIVKIEGRKPIPILTKSAKRIPVIGEWLSNKIRRKTTKHYYLKIKDNKVEKVYEMINKDTLQEVKDKEKIELAYLRAGAATEIALSGTDTATARKQIKDLIKKGKVTRAPDVETTPEEAIAVITPVAVEEFPDLVYDEVEDVRDYIESIRDIEEEHVRELNQLRLAAKRESVEVVSEELAQAREDVSATEEELKRIRDYLGQSEQDAQEAAEQVEIISRTEGITLEEKARAEQAALIEEENLRRAKAREIISRYVGEMGAREVDAIFAQLNLEEAELSLEEKRGELAVAQFAYDEEQRKEEIIREHSPRIMKVAEALFDYKDGFYATDLNRMIAFIFNDESMTGKTNHEARIGDIKPIIYNLYDEILKTFIIADYDIDKDYSAEPEKLEGLKRQFSVQEAARYMDMETEARIFKILNEMVTKAEIPTHSTERMQDLLGQIDLSTINLMVENAENLRSNVPEAEAGLAAAKAEVDAARAGVEAAQLEFEEASTIRNAAEEAYQEAVADYSPIEADAPISTIALAIPELTPESVQKIGASFLMLADFVKTLGPLEDWERTHILQNIGLDQEEIDKVLAYLKQLEEREFDIIYAAVPSRDLDEFKDSARRGRRRRSMMRIGMLIPALLLLFLLQAPISDASREDIRKDLEDGTLKPEDLDNRIRQVRLEEINVFIEESEKAEPTKDRLKRHISKKGTKITPFKNDPVTCPQVAGICQYMCKEDYDIYWVACEPTQVCCVKQ